MDVGKRKGFKKKKTKTTSTKNKTKKKNDGSSTSSTTSSSTSSSSSSQKGEDKTAKTLSEKKNIEDGPVLTTESPKKKTYEDLKHMWTKPLDIHPSAAFRELDDSDIFNLKVLNRLNELKQMRIDNCDPAYENPDDYTDVIVELIVNHIHEPDTLNQEVYVEFTLSMLWKEKELVGDGDETGHQIKPKNYEMLYDAKVGFVGDIDVEAVTDEDQAYWMEYLWSDYGIIRRDVNFKGKIRMPLNLTTFPFDNQVFRLTVYSKWSLYVNFHPMYESEAYLAKFMKPLAFYGWHVIPDLRQNSAGCRYFYRNEDENTYPDDTLEMTGSSQVTIEIDLRRNIGFYLNKIILIQTLINLFLFSFFSLPIDDVANRLNGVVTLLLTSVAFSFAIATDLPKVPYFTLLDYFFVINYIFIALVAVAFIILSRLRYHITPPGYNASSLESQGVESIYYGILTSDFEVANGYTALGMGVGYCVIIFVFCLCGILYQNYWEKPRSIIRPKEEDAVPVTKDDDNKGDDDKNSNEEPLSVIVTTNDTL